MADPAPTPAVPTVDPAAKLRDDVARFLADARAAAAGGLTVAEFGSLTLALLKLTVTGLEAIPTDGPSKKAWALGIIGTLFDSVAGYAVPVYLQPIWLVTEPAIRILLLAFASGALEQILHLTRAAAAAPAPGDA